MVRIVEQRITRFLGADVPMVIGHGAFACAFQRQQIVGIDDPFGSEVRDVGVTHREQTIGLARLRATRGSRCIQLSRVEILIF